MIGLLYCYITKCAICYWSVAMVAITQKEMQKNVRCAHVIYSVYLVIDRYASSSNIGSIAFRALDSQVQMAARIVIAH